MKICFIFNDIYFCHSIWYFFLFQTIIISITDTNNNDPLFRTNEKNELEFTVIPPLSPGFSITGCLDDIIVRDIDLTTERIKYEIFESPLFEISYDAASSTEPKEFKASLRTTQFIRSIPEPIVFRISATVCLELKW